MTVAPKGREHAVTAMSPGGDIVELFAPTRRELLEKMALFISESPGMLINGDLYSWECILAEARGEPLPT